ncbi:hypothetical protein K431DRAFT_206131, partial [Polychaeton citri CBS 116435]
LELPLELRQQILRYLLPYTKELSSTPFSQYLSKYRAAQEQGRSCLNMFTGFEGRGLVRRSTVVWQKANVSVMSVCRQLHDECADILYGENTFLLLVDYSGVIFKFRWLSAAGLTPHSTFNFFTDIPRKYMIRLKRAIVYVDHVDSYTGMTKFNVGGPGLTHGLRTQVQRLVDAL